MNSSPPSPPLLSRLWPILLLVLTAFGVPAAIVALFTRFVTEHPILALGIWLLYEVVVFVFGFVGKVWLKLEGPWVERTAMWLDHWIQGIISRYRKQYYRYLCFQHRDFDVKGLTTLGTHTLELDQIFVELSIDLTAPRQAIVNPIQVPKALLEGGHAIWDYLTSAPLSNQHFVIVGPPGSGKTTLLKRITLTLAAQRNSHDRSRHVRIPHKLPILLFLRDHATVIDDNPNFSLVDALHDHLKKWDQPLPPTGWVKRQLTRGRCLVMLDGLDEVADPKIRQAVVNWVQRQIVVYRQNRFLVTSRPFGYRNNPLSGVTILEVQSFTTEQVDRFIHKWYLANEIMSKQKDDSGVRMKAKAEAAALVQRLRNTPALFDLTVNPLLLTMIALVHHYRGRLPGNRVALYEEICEVFLGKRQEARGQVLELTPAQMQLVLEPLAYHLMVKGIRDIALNEVRTVIAEPLARVSAQMTHETFLQLVENISGLLLERENGVYSFAHLTFQEYLAATYIRDKHLGHTLAARVGMPWWQETIRLYCAIADATPIIVACLADDHPSTATIELAIDCDREAREVRPDVRTKLETLLKQGVEDLDLERQHVFAGALLARRLRRMDHLKDKTYIDTTLITCAEYQVFLDEQRTRGQYLQPDHWFGEHFSSGQGQTPVLGVRSSDAAAFCAWLTSRESDTWHYRLPRAGDEGISSNLTANTGYWTDGGKGLVWAKGGPLLSNRIRALASDHDVNRALASTGDQIHLRDASFVSDLIGPRDHLDVNLDHDFTLASVYADDLASARARVFDQIHPNSQTSVRDLVCDLAHIRLLNHSLSFDLGEDLSRVLAQAHNFTPVLEEARDLPVARDLANDLDRVLIYVRTLNSTRIRSNFEGRGLLEFISECIRLLMQVLSAQLFYWSWEQPAYRKSSNRKRMDDMVKVVSNICLDVYASFALLEERIQGMLPAFEGILIVKEYRN